MEIQTSSQGWFNALIGVIVGLMATLGAVYKGKITVLERRQMSFITREELERIVDQLRADRMQQHTETLMRIKDIGDDINRLHDRIDDVLSR